MWWQHNPNWALNPFLFYLSHKYGCLRLISSDSGWANRLFYLGITAPLSGALSIQFPLNLAWGKTDLARNSSIKNRKRKTNFLCIGLQIISMLWLHMLTNLSWGSPSNVLDRQAPWACKMRLTALPFKGQRLFGEHVDAAFRDINEKTSVLCDASKDKPQSLHKRSIRSTQGR